MLKGKNRAVQRTATDLDENEIATARRRIVLMQVYDSKCCGEGVDITVVSGKFMELWS